MIQRVQSIYLILIFVLVGVMSFLPLVIFQTSDHIFYMNLFYFEGVEHLSFAVDLPNIWPIAAFAIVLALLSVYSLFRFQNRKQQMMLNMINMLVNFGLLISIFLYADSVASFADVKGEVIYDVAAYFPIVTVLLLILANRNIRKDEKMVKQSDRLR